MAATAGDTSDLRVVLYFQPIHHQCCTNEGKLILLTVDVTAQEWKKKAALLHRRVENLIFPCKRHLTTPIRSISLECHLMLLLLGLIEKVPSSSLPFSACCCCSHEQVEIGSNMKSKLLELAEAFN
jgi:hypothetical protein